MANKTDAFPSGADVGALVVDLGTEYIRAGNAGDDCPKFFAHSCVGIEEGGHISDEKIKYEFPVSFTSLRNDLDIKPCLMQPSIDLNNPFDINSVLAPVEPVKIDKEAFDLILNRIFNSDNGGLREGLEGKPVIISEPNHHNREESMAEILFESCKAEAVYTMKCGVLTSFAGKYTDNLFYEVGRTGGLVIDLGAFSTSITAVQDGYTLQKSIIELPIGGHLMDYQLSHLLKESKLDSKIVPVYSIRKIMRHVPSMPSIIDNIVSISTEKCKTSFYTYSCREVLRWMKESIAHVSEDPLQISNMNHQIKQAHMSHHITNKYELPDGTCVETENVSRILPECLFNFEAILGITAPLPSSLQSVIHAVAHCIQTCDVDYRRDLLSSLIISGGCSMTPGLTERAIRDFQDADNTFISGYKYKIISPASSLERKFLSWIGASIVASLSSFQQMWMSKSEFEEHGVGLLERRCIQ